MLECFASCEAIVGIELDQVSKQIQLPFLGQPWRVWTDGADKTKKKGNVLSSQARSPDQCVPACMCPCNSMVILDPMTVWPMRINCSMYLCIKRCNRLHAFFHTICPKSFAWFNLWHASVPVKCFNMRLMTWWKVHAMANALNLGDIELYRFELHVSTNPKKTNTQRHGHFSALHLKHLSFRSFWIKLFQFPWFNPSAGKVSDWNQNWIPAYPKLAWLGNIGLPVSGCSWYSPATLFKNLSFKSQRASETEPWIE